MNMKGRDVWSCGRKNRKFRGENRHHLDNCIRGCQEDRFSYHKSLSKSTMKQISARHISEAVYDRWADGQYKALVVEIASHEVVTDVVIVDETVLDKVYGLKRKRQDWLYAKACECGCVTVSRGGRLEFHRIRRQPRNSCRYTRRFLQKVA